MTAWITTPIEPLLCGVLDVEHTADGLLPHRFPAAARKQFPDDYLATVEAQPAGVRLAFRTEATGIELDALPTRAFYPGVPAPAAGVYELLVDGRPAGNAAVPGTGRLVDMTTQAVVAADAAAGTLRFDLPAGAKDIEIWLPHTETAALVALRTNAPVRPAAADGRKVWLHHGSSISHGSNADRPTATWPALAAARGGVSLRNLSLRGNCLLDPFVARTIRDTPADLISLKLGINLVSSDVMRVRAFTPTVHGFLDTIRDGHPDTPLLVVSPLLCPIHEDTPGPGALDFDGQRVRFRALGDPAERANGKLTLNVVRDELVRIVEQRAADDANLHYLDGRLLYGEQDFAELPLPDQLHPDPATHRRIGERFADLAFGASGPLAPAG
ncbi:GDSL-type esterase/lipase family protein [Nocardia brasiliensis]|uniref:GDSL-type esterase/lipase family protein n=1 Tax=Nocardia brasiliensis TaxID=37326 RepID=UPI0004A6E624|nr:GDSL-type esterase/lipase family protein [Nocardia brasiliensis]